MHDTLDLRSANPSSAEAGLDAGEAQDLHDALEALSTARTGHATTAELHVLRSDVIHASVALAEQGRPDGPTVPASAVARVLRDLDTEVLTVTTVAGVMAGSMPAGRDRDDVLEIFEAGTRAAADVVRLENLVKAGDAGH